jgi:hypothetical protein
MAAQAVTTIVTVNDRTIEVAPRNRTIKRRVYPYPGKLRIELSTDTITVIRRATLAVTTQRNGDMSTVSAIPALVPRLALHPVARLAP